MAKLQPLYNLNNNDQESRLSWNNNETTKKDYNHF